MPSNLEHIYNIVCEKILSINLTHDQQHNLTRKQYNVLTEFKDNSQLVIKKADKGSNVVVMNTHDYIKEGERQLTDNTFYRRCKTDHTKGFKNKIDSFLNTLWESKEISDKTYTYLKEGGHRTSVFYLLPKIHKSFKHIPPGRLIVSSVDSPTERISKLLDIILKPYVIRSKSYVEDTPDFIRKIHHIKLNKDDWLIGLDVVSLYTNIPHDGGLMSV